MAEPLNRRDLLRLTSGAVVSSAAFTVGIVGAPAASAAHDPSAETISEAGADRTRPVRQLRAMWIAAVENIDYPSKPGLSAEEQKKEFLAWLDLAQELRLNAVISQVRPTADAFWPSDLEPFSHWLTGEQGKDPGYDPLAFQVRAAHARNLEFHAWFNPFRVAQHDDPSALVADHPARVHPDWVFAYGKKLYYNPGLPAVRSFVQDAMMDAVTRYDIDAVHFDDYFYPYPVDGEELPDADAFAQYGAGQSVEDWRRQNITLLTEEMGTRIKTEKPWVKFGVSPFGIWRNQSSDPRGSATSGSGSYETVYADTLDWVKKGLVDYICPQIYWEIGHPAADYAELTSWWCEQVKDTNVSLFIGQAVYKSTSGEFGAAELTEHLTFNRSYPSVDGDAFFSAKDLRSDTAGAVTAMVKQHYSTPALVPEMPHLKGTTPSAPVGVQVSAKGDAAVLSWNRASAKGATSFAIWRLPAGQADGAALGDGRNLLATVRADDRGGRQTLTLTGSAPVRGTFVVTALDRLWNQSAPSRPVRI
ncbi:glycoside hydrolase family 10 protein [Helcobacillus massiliensis]|uniref:glycoside hydrolase family 10 protein n=1 Tax=Helcobacillus massiliensis TaxID=521392 RepID=UPI002556EDDE|nr:family 10 glycosylhydrolase [Helcobacillus massiliensis]MDK7742217.1 family 10 glycosylhydrolase [Helcobacillus massiliensis]WOO93769.1 family 10 glycosylhydrolase [Helcobacillus massiliensis]